MTDMRIERKWSMPNKWTFIIPPIRDLLNEEIIEWKWIDPFAWKNSPVEITNDIRENMPSKFHMDALEFLKMFPDQYIDGVLFDPPYSITQAKECYEWYGFEKLETKPTSMKYWSDCKTEISRIVRPWWKVICFWWTSMWIWKNRWFSMERILLVPHGWSRNDTICTVEIKK